jgi:hypothetical protein
MARTRPAHVILVHAEPGLAVFVDSILKLLDVRSPVIIWASPAHPVPERLTARLEVVASEPNAPKSLDRARRHIGEAGGTLVLYAVDATPKMTWQNLADYAAFLQPGDYLAALRTARGQPWINYARLRAARAVAELVREVPGLEIDTSWDRHVLTSCPSGFVRRTADAPT